MNETRISISNVLNENKARSVVSKLSYSIENMRGCHLDTETGEIVIISDEQDENHVKVAERLIASEKSIKEFKQKLLKDNRTQPQGLEAHENEFVDYVAQLKSEQGYYLMSKIDNLFRGFSYTFNAELRRYRSLISRETLERCDYAHSFPQNLYLVSEFPHNLDSISGIRASNDYDNYTQPSEFLLSPAVCFHCYEELQDQVLTKPTVVTAEGTCFRHEAHWRVNNFRRKEFNMREIVYLGPASFVEEIRHQLLESVWDLFNEIGLQGKVETASDPFYFVEDQEKGLHQLFAKMKYELVVALRNGESFAIASFNNVGQSLCNTFGIKSTTGDSMHSGCAAFGLDRWVYTLLVEFGTNINSWPDSVKKILDL